MTPEAVEAHLLQTVVVPELQAEGYDVYLHPQRPRLPEFFGNFVPDAIALGAKKNLAVEVLRRSQDSSQKLERIKELLRGHDDWELRVFFAEPASTRRTLNVLAPDIVRSSIFEIKELAARGNLSAALLQGWATFEALARILAPSQFERPQTPGRLVQVLAQSGHLTPSEADQLRHLANLRTEFIHGGLGVSVRRTDIEAFVSVLETLLVEMK